jgi:hypothetical protein
MPDLACEATLPIFASAGKVLAKRAPIMKSPMHGLGFSC